MTRQKTLKRDVRARMAKTGERYTAARRQLIGAQRTPSPEPAHPAQPDFEPPTSEAALHRATGRGWNEWFGILDERGTTGKTHAEIARWLAANHEIPHWWVQTITVAYERARGMRQKHQLTSGFAAGASKTVAVAAERLFDAFVDQSLRARWLPSGQMRERTSRRARGARFDWPDGSLLVVSFEAKGPAKATVFIQHEKLADGAQAEAMKLFWRERLAALKVVLER
jgi:hypothetical protein